MPVTDQTPIIAHTANGVSTAFAFPFLLDQSSDLIVMVGDALKTLATDYTVSGTGNPAGGTVTFTTAPANGVRVVFTRRTALQRLTDYQTGGANRANVLDADLDRLWMALQDGWLGVQKAVRYQNGDAGPTRMPVLSDGQVLGQLGGLLVGRDTLPSGDGVNFIQSGGGAIVRTMQDKAREIVSVKDFGARGDGVTDDTTAIQTAINACAGKALYFPAGIYQISSELVVSAPMNVFGDGNCVSVIRTTNASANVFTVNAGTNILTGFLFRDIHIISTVAKTGSAAAIAFMSSGNGCFYDVALRNIKTDTNQAHGIFMQCVAFYVTMDNIEIGGVGQNKFGFYFRGQATGKWIANVWMTKCRVRTGVSGSTTSGAVFDSYTQGFYVSDCGFESTLNNGIQITNTLAATRPSENFFFTNCFCDYSRSNGIIIDNVLSAHFINCWFSSCLADGARVIAGTDISFVDCYGMSNGQSGLHVGPGARFVRVSGGIYDVNDQGGGGWSGINLDPNVSDITITDAQFSRAGSTPSQDYAIQLFGGTSSNVIIKQNNLSGGAVGALNIGTLSGTGNIIEDNAGAWAGSATYDPPSLTAGSGVTTTVTVNGAQPGMFATASFTTDLQGILLHAWVSGANTVSVRFQNQTGGTIDLGSGTLRARVALKS